MNVNKVILAGRLCRDPELSYTPGGTAVCDFSLATNRTYSKQDGSRGEEVCFVEVRAFGKSAETLNKYVAKGSPLFLEGRLSFDSWTGQDNKRHSKHRVTLESFQFLPSGGRREPGDDRDDGRVDDPGYDRNRDYGAERGRKPLDDSDIPF